jgi:hypothetical protein
VFRGDQARLVERYAAEDNMDWLIFVGVLALWLVVQAWLLPRLGVPT